MVGALALAWVGACAGQRGRAFEEMSPEEHLRAAEREERMADEEMSKVNPTTVEPGQRLPGEVWPVGYAPFDGSFLPGEPEYYTIDPRVRDPSEKHIDAARKHRTRAQRHFEAAERQRGVY